MFWSTAEVNTWRAVRRSRSPDKNWWSLDSGAALKRWVRGWTRAVLVSYHLQSFWLLRCGNWRKVWKQMNAGALPCIITDERRSPLPRQENNGKGPKRKETVYWIKITVISSNIPTLPPTNQPNQKMKSTLFSGIKTKGLSLPSKISVHCCSLMPNLFLKNKK